MIYKNATFLITKKLITLNIKFSDDAGDATPSKTIVEIHTPDHSCPDKVETQIICIPTSPKPPEHPEPTKLPESPKIPEPQKLPEPQECPPVIEPIICPETCLPKKRICCPIKVCASDDALKLPIEVPNMGDKCCLEMQVKCKEMQIMYLQEKQLLEHKLHHRQQLIWNQEQLRRKEFVKREQQIQ